jgi:hypothetical protein
MVVPMDSIPRSLCRRPVSSGGSLLGYFPPHGHRPRALAATARAQAYNARPRLLRRLRLRSSRKPGPMPRMRESGHRNIRPSSRCDMIFSDAPYLSYLSSTISAYVYDCPGYAAGRCRPTAASDSLQRRATPGLLEFMDKKSRKINSSQRHGPITPKCDNWNS